MIFYWILATLLFVTSLILYKFSLDNKISNQRQEQKKQQLIDEIDRLELNKIRVTKAILQDAEKLKASRESLEQVTKKAIEDKNYEFQVKTQLFKDRMRAGMSDYEQRMEAEYQKIDARFQALQSETSAKIRNYEAKLAALVENDIRQQKLKDDLAFYTIQLSKEEIYDIIELQKVKKLISKPEVVGKIIWSSYCLPKMARFETRLLPNKNKVIGIYKITNSQNKMVYIGQSKDIATRWRDHIKCGLGATPAAIGNKLYQGMNESGIWNFTFELLEQCKETELNEKEKYWIGQYQSNVVGYNTKVGNK